MSPTDGVRCPRCGQAFLHTMQILRSDEVITRCPDCDATWIDPDVPGRDPFVQYDLFLESRGWSSAGEVRRLG